MWNQYMQGEDGEAEGLWDWLMAGQQEVVHAKEAGLEQRARARARDAERHRKDGTFDLAPKKAKVGGWNRLLEAMAMRKDAKNVAAVEENNKQYTAMTIAIQLVESGKWIRVIADTGASVSLFPRRSVANSKLYESSAKLKAANGGGIEVMGSSKVKFRILGSDNIWEHKSEVVKDSAPNILGVDFWEPLQAEISMPKRRIEIIHPVTGEKESIPMSLMRGEEAASACTVNSVQTGQGREENEIVRATCDIELLPNEPVMMEWPLKGKLKDSEAVYWSPATTEVSTVECCTGIEEEDFYQVKLTASAVLQPMWSDKEQEIVVRQVLYNPTEETMHIRAGTPVGSIELAEVYSMEQMLEEAVRQKPEMIAAAVSAILDSDVATEGLESVMAVIARATGGPDKPVNEVCEVQCGARQLEDSKIENKPKFDGAA